MTYDAELVDTVAEVAAERACVDWASCYDDERDLYRGDAIEILDATSERWEISRRDPWPPVDPTDTLPTMAALLDAFMPLDMIAPSGVAETSAHGPRLDDAGEGDCGSDSRTSLTGTLSHRTDHSLVSRFAGQTVESPESAAGVVPRFAALPSRMRRGRFGGTSQQT